LRSSLSLTHLFSTQLRPLPTSPLFPYTTLFRSHMDPATAIAEMAQANNINLRVYIDLNPGTNRTGIHPGKEAEVLFEKAKTLNRSEEHTSELQSRENLVCRLLLEKKKNKITAKS